MANTITLRTVLAASAAGVALLLSTAGSCGSPVQSSQVCVGPEDPDDLEDLLDRDTVVHDLARCQRGDPAFSLVTVDGPAPEVGTELEDDGTGTGHYRRTSSHRGSAPSSRASTPSTPASGAARATTAPSARSSAARPTATRATTAARATTKATRTRSAPSR